MEDQQVSENPKVFSQEHEEVVLPKSWWWASLLGLATLALLANFIFLMTIVYNRKRNDLKTFVTALIVTVSVLDVIDVLRIIPVLVKSLFLEEIFRHVYCSLGVFHELAVALFLVILSIVVCCQSGKEPKLYQNQVKNSCCAWIHKVVVPLVLLGAIGASAPFFLLPYKRLFHTCIDPFRIQFVLDYESEEFQTDLYSTIITIFTYVLPILILPFSIPISYLRICIGKQCCIARFKQPIGELVMTTFIALVYLLTVVGVILPRLDKIFDLKIGEEVKLGPAPLLWELGNNALRPIIIFMTNPAVWEGLQHLFCKSKHQMIADEDGEIEVPLSPVTTV